MRYKFILFILILTSHSSFSQKKQTEKDILNTININLKLKNFTEKTPVIINNDTLAFIYNFNNGYAVISNYDNYYPLKAFSTSSRIDLTSPNFDIFLSLLTKDYKLQQKYISSHPEIAKSNQISWKNWLNNSKSQLTDSIGPLLKSEYGQVNCHDNTGKLVNVTNYYTPSNYAVGCVAISFATTMRYFNWPIQGTSSHSYSDKYGSSTGSYAADFENTTYLWDNIQNKYNDTISTDDTRKALGKIMYHAAISVDMDFENGGSTSDITKIPKAINDYFRYETPLYRTISAGDFWTLLDSSLVSGSPTQLAVSTSSGSGHAIVCDGIKYTDNPNNKYYHLNMGWWGTSNGWYLIQSDYNAGGYSVVDAAVMGLMPLPELQKPVYNSGTNTLSLKWYAPKMFDSVTYDLEYKINTGTWETLVENYSELEYDFTPDMNNIYYFRIKSSKNSSWSAEEKFNPVEELQDLKEIKFYPTLVTTKINIEYINLKNTQLYIISENGRIAYSENLGNYSGYSKQINVSFLPKGMYFIKIITDDKKEVTGKFIIQGDK